MNIGEFFNDVVAVLGMAANVAQVEVVSNTTTDGVIIDLRQFAGAKFDFFSGVVTDGDFEWQIWHGNDSGLSDEAEVDSTDIHGSIPDWEDHDNDDDNIESVVYLGGKDYVQAKIVSTNVGSGGFMGLIVNKIKPTHMPAQT